MIFAAERLRKVPYVMHCNGLENEMKAKEIKEDRRILVTFDQMD